MTRLLSEGSKLSPGWSEKLARKYCEWVSQFSPFPSDRGIDYDHDAERNMVSHCAGGGVLKNSVDWAEHDNRPVREAQYRIRFD